MRPIELDDKALLTGLFKKYPSDISELTFTNLFAWRHAYNFNLSDAGDFLLVVSLNKDLFQVFDPLGPFDTKEKCVRKCFSVCGSNTELKFIRLPGKTAEIFKKAGGLRLLEDRDDFDYVYLAQDLIGLKGRDFDGKRNFIKRFKDNNSFMYKKLLEDDVKECISFQEEWCLAKDCQHTQGLAKERQAMREMLANFEYLGMQGGMIEIAGKVEAVALGEQLNPETFVVHIEKANGSFIGIYQATNQLFCDKEASGYKYINREQDLGVPGLRQAKESYHPCHMVKKFTLVRA
ncbi:MAG: hypothetical protein AUJ74_03915 [Candidatus Omnitrophica bacterium CG1_02_44_16]|nr:MAG: hypothetical protein AUJ74_03915 [Candidatus Omnitrophica bacterium CG1_02_44_16]